MLNRFVDWIKSNFSKNKNSNSEFEQKKIKIREFIENDLNYNVNNYDFFYKAFTHRSYLEKTPDVVKSNERLEFLGDAVLGLIAAEYLFNKFQNDGEGFLTKTRSHLVNKAALTEASDRLNLSELILYDNRYIRNSEDGLRTISANTVESLIGAIYLDQGLEEAKSFITEWIIVPSFKDGSFKEDKNYKGQLLEFTHANKLNAPIYNLNSEDGPQHKKIFCVEVIIGEDSFGIGEGKSKKSAEQDASEKALKKLQSM